MFAIIETGGKQYKVAKGDKVDIEKLEGKDGASITFDKVLLISDKGKTKIGTPLVEKAKVEAKLVTQKKDDKTVVFKMKAKKRYQRTQGHRQSLTTVEITDIKG
ncbi:MAG: 50S ribosomal protein L21 [Candidatus Peregrinibacteria bacterium]